MRRCQKLMCSFRHQLVFFHADVQLGIPKFLSNIQLFWGLVHIFGFLEIYASFAFCIHQNRDT